MGFGIGEFGFRRAFTITGFTIGEFGLSTSTQMGIIVFTKFLYFTLRYKDSSFVRTSVIDRLIIEDFCLRIPSIIRGFVAIRYKGSSFWFSKKTPL